MYSGGIQSIRRIWVYVHFISNHGYFRRFGNSFNPVYLFLITEIFSVYSEDYPQSYTTIPGNKREVFSFNCPGRNIHNLFICNFHVCSKYCYWTSPLTYHLLASPSCLYSNLKLFLRIYLLRLVSISRPSIKFSNSFMPDSTPCRISYIWDTKGNPDRDI